MLKTLSRRLQWIFTSILMGIITLILIFAFSRQYEAQKAADTTHIQRMASLLVYALKDDPENTEEILKSYEETASVYSYLTDKDNHTLFKSSATLPTSLDTLMEQASNDMTTLPTVEKTAGTSTTTQSGYVELTGDHHDHYLMILSQIPIKNGQMYHLTNITRQTSLWEQGIAYLPFYGVVWLLTFFILLFLIRWMLKKSFAPTEQMLISHRNFIASASHELKAPLAVIMANVGLLQSYTAKDPQTAGILSTIDAECNRMSHLIRDLLFLASSDANQQKIHPSDVEVDTLLFSLYEAFEPLCLKKQIPLIPDFSSESYPTLYTDAERLFQLLGIFLDNAISYAPKGSPIKLRAVFDGNELIFSVIDHGKGISKEDQPFIFDRFYCADASRTEKQHFGLGLSIAKELAKLLGGTVGFSETKGGGATFYLKLPVQ